MKSKTNLYKLATSFLSGLSIRKVKELLDKIHHLDHLFEYTDAEIQRVYNVNKGVIKKINRNKALEIASIQMDYCIEHGGRFLFYQDNDYPYFLKQCIDAPIVLFVQGSLNLENKKIISIVGTRKNTSYGEEILKELIPNLKPYKNIVVVSGLAYGIDIITHRLCIKYGIDNIAVLGHGLDKVYPLAHKTEAKELGRKGLLLSEYRYYQSIKKFNFPNRNRIIAGISEATVVIESMEKGGSLITAQMAFDYDREVFCFPGSIFQKHSKGCNNLIKKGVARPIENHNDLCFQLNWKVRKPSLKTIKEHQIFNTEEKSILNILVKKNKVQFDDLAVQVGIKTNQLNHCLLELELRGMIRKHSNNRFELINS